MAETFGAFIARQRVEKDLKLRALAIQIGVSESYMSDLKRGNRLPPKGERLEALADAMNLTEEERTEMFDIAARERGEVSVDLVDYVMDEDLPTLRQVLRKAKKLELDDSFWEPVQLMLKPICKK